MESLNVQQTERTPGNLEVKHGSKYRRPRHSDTLTHPASTSETEKGKILLAGRSADTAPKTQYLIYNGPGHEVTLLPDVNWLRDAGKATSSHV